MPEIKTPLVRLPPGATYTASSGGAVLITERHTISDIVRYAVSCADYDEVWAIVEMMADDEAPSVEPL